MKFSLIVATINRVAETERLFQSLTVQGYQDFEVIVVDQSPDERYRKLIESYRQQFPILHLRETRPGTSRARNIGLENVQGEIVAFPDDDCLYSNGLLAKIAQFFGSHPEWDGLITRVFDLDADENAFEPCGDDCSQGVDYAKGYKVCVSPAMFFRVPIARKITFNESLGPGIGTPWSSGDETDYLFQCLDAGYRFYYDAELIVRHPNPLKKHTFREQMRREYRYGVGKGYFLATHHLPPSLLRIERQSPYRDALTKMSEGNLRRASYFLINGIGTSIGYRAGLKV